MAISIWKYADDPIGLGLLGCCLYTEMASVLQGYDTEGRQLLLDKKNELETAATEMINVCFARSKVTARIDWILRSVM